MKSFNLAKMESSLIDGQAHYKMGLENEKLDLNNLIGQDLRLIFKHQINCIHCFSVIKKSYSGGHCYPCSIKLAATDLCILKPELCHYSKGTCREPLWGQSHCMVPHYVYLANSSGLKVGITRATQLPTRWIDQGAVAGLPIIKVSSRYQSGLFEKLISSEISDKTDWRKMLKGSIDEIDLEEKRDELFELFGESIDDMEAKLEAGAIEILENAEIVSISYPVLEYPLKVNSLSLDKNEVVGGKLLGIKGQYLIFNTGVLNIRSHTGYKIDLEY
jgi:hypothetical protein